MRRPWPSRFLGRHLRDQERLGQPRMYEVCEAVQPARLQAVTLTVDRPILVEHLGWGVEREDLEGRPLRLLVYEVDLDGDPVYRLALRPTLRGVGGDDCPNTFIFPEGTGVNTGGAIGGGMRQVRWSGLGFRSLVELRAGAELVLRARSLTNQEGDLTLNVHGYLMGYEL